MNRSGQEQRCLRNLQLARCSLATACLALGAAPANAEIRLLEPLPRYVSSNRSCPCGMGASNGTCNAELDGSDDARSSRISRFEAGETIVVRVDEYVDELGRLRVAFDPSGADTEDFNANVLLDVADILEFREGARQFTVELPDTPCSDCTLQVVQIAHGITDRPVADPSPFLSFYTCADIELVPPGTPPPGGSSGPDEPLPLAADAGIAAPPTSDPVTSVDELPLPGEQAAEGPGARNPGPGDAGAMASTATSQQTSRDVEDARVEGCSVHSGQTPRATAGWLILWALSSLTRHRRRNKPSISSRS